MELLYFVLQILFLLHYILFGSLVSQIFDCLIDWFISKLEILTCAVESLSSI